MKKIALPAWSGLLILNTLLHAVVDMSCCYALFRFATEDFYGAELTAKLFLTYNLLAFGLQFVFGLLLSKKDPLLTAGFGCLLVMSGLCLLRHPVWATVFLGIGNALFHVGGGVETLKAGKGRASFAGIFVSSGALGVFFGSFVGKAENLYSLSGLILVLFMIAATVSYLWIAANRTHIPENKPFYIPENKPLVSLPLLGFLLLFIAVFVRSYTGFAVSMPWKEGFWLTFGVAAASFAGKFVGGFLADKLGQRLVAAVSLLIAMPLLALFNTLPALCLLGSFLLNISMSVTLCGTVSLFGNASRLNAGGKAGFAFGLTTVALMAGYLLFGYADLSFLNSPVGLLVVIGVSAVAGFLALPSSYKKQ